DDVVRHASSPRPRRLLPASGQPYRRKGEHQAQHRGQGGPLTQRDSQHRRKPRSQHPRQRRDDVHPPPPQPAIEGQRSGPSPHPGERAPGQGGPRETAAHHGSDEDRARGGGDLREEPHPREVAPARQPAGDEVGRAVRQGGAESEDDRGHGLPLAQIRSTTGSSTETSSPYFSPVPVFISTTRSSRSMA